MRVEPKSVHEFGTCKENAAGQCRLLMKSEFATKHSLNQKTRDKRQRDERRVEETWDKKTSLRQRVWHKTKRQKTKKQETTRRIWYVFWTLKCRRKSDLGLCMSSAQALAKRMRLGSASSRWIFSKSNRRELALPAKHILKSEDTRQETKRREKSWTETKRREIRDRETRDKR